MLKNGVGRMVLDTDFGNLVMHQLRCRKISAARSYRLWMQRTCFRD